MIIFCGPSAAGKTTVARLIQRQLVNTELVDADEVRGDISPGLGFTLEDRLKHAQNVGQYLAQRMERPLPQLATFILPLLQMRQIVRQELDKAEYPYLMVWLDIPIQLCQQRDKKGVYARQDVPGMGFPLETPEPDEEHTLVLDSLHLRNDPKQLPPYLADRLGSCRNCQYFDADEAVCGFCGCDIQRLTIHPSNTCPDDRWRVSFG